MKRLAVFAGYDREGVIHDYVVYYLQELSKSADVIYVADNELAQNETNKIKDYVIKIIAEKHGEYDFGSYKRGYLFAKENGILDKYDFLILCNDSVFGPFYPFDEIFVQIPQRQDMVYGFSKHLRADCDWGGEKHKVIEEHLQSYFIVMPKSVFLSKWYSSFINSIKKEDDKVEVIFKYEIGMSVLFKIQGLKLVSHYENAEDISFTNPLEVFRQHDGIFLKKKRVFEFYFATICQMFALIVMRNFTHRAITAKAGDNKLLAWGGGLKPYDIDLIIKYYERTNHSKLIVVNQETALNLAKYKKVMKKAIKLCKLIPIKKLKERFIERYIVFEK